ncbi:hypothetical protein ACN469_10580 [Corallococcus terminator]
MANLIDLIGESAPYVNAYDLNVVDGVLHGRFKPEQQRYSETTLLNCSEALRFSALHAVLTCAAANPVQAKRYYLAAKADLQVFPVKATRTKSFRCEGRVTSIEEKQQLPYFKATATCFTEEGERYAVMHGECITLTEEKFVAIKGADEAPAKAWTPGQPNPHQNPVRPMKLDWVKPGEVLKAQLDGLTREDFAGHFDVRAICPLTILVGNAVSLVSHFPGFDVYRINRCMSSCKDVPFPGESVRLTCAAEAAGQFKITVENAQGKFLAAIQVDATPDSR